MNWMFESRSNNYYDDDPEGGPYPPNMQWYEYLLFIPAMFLFAILPVLIILCIILNNSYEIAKRAYESGELEYPGLTFTGGGVAIILFTLISNYLFDISDHPFITLFSSVFILLCTIAPLAGLALRLFSQFITFLEKLSSINLFLLFMGAGLAITLFFLSQ